MTAWHLSWEQDEDQTRPAQAAVIVGYLWWKSKAFDGYDPTIGQAFERCGLGAPAAEHRGETWHNRSWPTSSGRR